MSETTTCPECGAEFVPSASPLGVCPACLLKLGASDPSLSRAPLTEESSGSAAAVTLPPSAPVARRRRQTRGWIAAAALAVLLFLAAWFLLRLPAAPGRQSGPVIRFRIAPPAGYGLSSDVQFAISPDGSRLALVARASEGTTQLWLRPLQSTEWIAMPGTEGAAYPFWSPDSRHVGFFSGRKLKTADVSSGVVLVLCDAPAGRGGSWGSQNVIVFAPRSTGPIHQVAASGGDARSVTPAAPGGDAQAWPFFLPDGKRFLYVAAAAGSSSVYVGDVAGPERKLIAAGAGAAAYAEGFVILSRGAALMAIPFDEKRAAPIGDAVAIAGTEHAGGNGAPGFSVSAAGLLVHAIGRRPARLTWMDRSGMVLAVVAEPAGEDAFSVSPDGRSVAFTRTDDSGASSIWIRDLERQVTSRLTLGQSSDRSPVWFPDGRQIAYASTRERGEELRVADVGNGTERTLIPASREAKQPLSWSPDGRLLLYSSDTAETGSDLWLVPAGETAPKPLMKGPYDESDGRFSPDGRWIVYVSNETGRDEVYVRSFPEAEARWQISQNGGSRPRWRSDGRELYFATPEGVLMAVEIRRPPADGPPHRFMTLPSGAPYEVAPDGRQFLVALPAPDAPSERLQVVLNWTSELRGRR